MRTLWTPKWLLVHAATIALVVAFLALGWWQLRRATGGNLLSFGYAVEWPAFAAFVIWVWAKELRQAVRVTHAGSAPAGGEAPVGPSPEGHRSSREVGRFAGRLATGPVPATLGATSDGLDEGDRDGPHRHGPHRRGPNRRDNAAYDDGDDAELRAYNHYLAWLGANPHAPASEYPGYAG